MCSTLDARLLRISEAIDQLAADYTAALRDGQAGEIASRLAGIWQLICDDDPELARRLPGYDLPR